MDNEDAQSNVKEGKTQDDNTNIGKPMSKQNDNTCAEMTYTDEMSKIWD